MYLLINKLVILFGLGLLFSQLSYAQSAVDSTTFDERAAFSDSIERVADSLETMMLSTSQTYQQVERLLSRFPVGSKQLHQLPSVLPVDLPIHCFRITSPFGLRQHPINKQIQFHSGVDVKAVAGMIVKATGPGIIAQVGYDERLGAFVRITHAFGFETTYGHLAGYCVRAGQQVQRNEQIGKVGSTGQTTGAHLHYTLKKNGFVVDPFEFCFLLRRRLSIYERSKTSGAKAPELTKGLSSRGW